MNKPEHTPGYVPNPDFSQEDWDEVSDNPELTDEQLANLRPASEVLPSTIHAALAKRGRGRPKSDAAKVAVKLRLDPATLDAFKADGPGWQTRINDVLSAHIADKKVELDR